MMDALDMDYFYSGGACTLKVEEVSSPFRINEYDGNETVDTNGFWGPSSSDD